MQGRVLIVAGSDSGGGAGMQADIKTITVLGGFAMTAITALTAQNTLGVHGVFPIPPDFIQQQIKVTLDDLGADVVKSGMLHDIPVIEGVLKTIPDDIPWVIDPVMMAKGGHALLEKSAIDAVRSLLVPRASILTPNIPEAEALTNLTIETMDDMKKAGEKLLAMGAGAVLMKGGHLDGDDLVDVLITKNAHETFTKKRIKTRHTHGTGCTTASAIATGLAKGQGLSQVVKNAGDFVHHAIATAPGFGNGHGPLNFCIGD